MRGSSARPSRIQTLLRILDREWLSRLRRKLTGRISAEECHLAVRDALDRMRRNQLTNRERVVTSITRMNQLQAMRSDLFRGAVQIERRLAGGEVNSSKLTDEVAVLQQTAESLTLQIRTAESAVEEIKRQIREEEGRFRKASARALAAELLINAEVCNANLARLLAEVQREYPEMSAGQPDRLKDDGH